MKQNQNNNNSKSSQPSSANMKDASKADLQGMSGKRTSANSTSSKDFKSNERGGQHSKSNRSQEK